jgi:hypothetical protein
MDGSTAPTLYKARGVPAKQAVCAICAERTRGATQRVGLGYGVFVWLCEAHAGSTFQTRRAGRDLVTTLLRLWGAHGCLTANRHRALRAHLRAVAPRAPRGRPGSYAWPSLRREAESLFAAGAVPAHVIVQLSRRHANDHARPPSTRTMHRWHAERRWLTDGRGEAQTLLPTVSRPGAATAVTPARPAATGTSAARRPAPPVPGSRRRPP